MFEKRIWILYENKKNSGTEEYYGLMGKVDIINSTLGKALGGAAGGYSKLF